MNELETMAKALVAPGKGILAADESLPTLEKRFAASNVACTEDSRRAYREMLFATPSLHRFISGVILHDETIRQCTKEGVAFPEWITKLGMIPGIKVDLGAKPLPRFPKERVTQGLDTLADRLAEYKQLGARFTKWRAVIEIGDGLPTSFAIAANAQALARYAALSQEAGLMPMVEPEVLMTGNHTIEHCYEVTAATLRSVFDALMDHRVVLEQMLLRPNMIVPGLNCPDQPGPDEVARKTLHCLRRVVPAAVPGVMFLSGGQTPERATAHLHAMNVIGRTPWELSFSFARALQEPVLKAWGGDEAKTSAGQKALYHRAKCNCAARYAKYARDMERQG
ncbi:MAG: fructose-bisphosphate aldolase class I [Verrucomicrobia bacterium]|nr:fructose-bisphosphate aldolase class I [Verrucomicrobiota bacterium]